MRKIESSDEQICCLSANKRCVIFKRSNDADGKEATQKRAKRRRILIYKFRKHNRTYYISEIGFLAAVIIVCVCASAQNDDENNGTHLINTTN